MVLANYSQMRTFVLISVSNFSSLEAMRFATYEIPLQIVPDNQIQSFVMN
jgi:hypothetical protein